MHFISSPALVICSVPQHVLSTRMYVNIPGYETKVILRHKINVPKYNIIILKSVSVFYCEQLSLCFSYVCIRSGSDDVLNIRIT